MLVRGIDAVNFAAAKKNVNKKQPGVSNGVYSQNVEKQKYAQIPFGALIHYSYVIPKNEKFLESSYEDKAKQVQAQLVAEAQNDSSWINLPAKLLQDGSVDRVYESIGDFKKAIPGKKHLIFVALGNPANADEAAKALGLGDNVTYCCAVREGNIKHAIQKAGGNLEQIQVMISSKSGTTFESNATYQLLQKQFEEYYKSEGKTGEDLKEAVAKHFLCLTDKNPSAKLKKEAIERGYKTIDCVDNLASGFGDLAYDLPLLAYAGLSKKDAVKMLEAARDITKEVLTNAPDNNLAARIAMFDKAARDNGATKEQFIFHDSEVDLSNTIAQLYRESLRKVNLELNTYPRSAHSGLQSAIDTELNGQSVNIITNVIPVGADKTQEAERLENAHIQNAGSEGHWQKTLGFELSEDGSGIKPEVLGEFLMLKSFIAYFKNQLEGTNHNMEKIDYVGQYKKIFQGG